MTTYTWVDGASGSVANGANWVGGVAPGPTDDVVISGTGTETLQVDGAATVANVTLSNPNATLAIADNGSLSTTGSFTDTTLKQITLGANAHLEVGSGQVILGFVSGTALSLGAGAVLQLDAPGTSAPSLTLKDSVTLTGDATLQVGAGGSIYAVGSNIDLGSHTLTVTGGPFDNRGGITVRSGGHLVVPGGFVNLAAADPGDPLGIVAFENGSETLSSGVVNDGVLIVDGGTLEVGANADGLALPGSGEIDLLSAAHFIQASGILANNIVFESTSDISLTYGSSSGFTGKLFGLNPGDTIHLNFDFDSASISNTAITLAGASVPSSAASIQLGSPVTGAPGHSNAVYALAHHLGTGGSDLVFVSGAPPTYTVTGLADAAIANGHVDAAHNSAGQTLTGSARAGLTVIVYDQGVELGATTADSANTWSYTLGHLAAGPHVLTAAAIDPNVIGTPGDPNTPGPLSDPLLFVADSSGADTTPPAAPTGLSDAAIVGGHVDAAHDTPTQTLTGAAEAGATVTVYDGTTALGTTLANASGVWSYTLGLLAVGGHSLTATATDEAANTGPASSPLAFTVDALPSTVHAWSDGASGYWAQGANWVGGTVPTASDDAAVLGLGADAIVVNGSVSINNLTLSDPNASLSVSGRLATTGELTVGHVGGISVSGDFVVGAGPLTLDNTTLSLGGGFYLGGLSDPDPVLTLGSHMRVQASGAGLLEASSGVAPARIYNYGVIDAGSYAMQVVANNFSNFNDIVGSNRITFDGPATSSQISLSNYGSIAVANQVYDGAVTNYGAMSGSILAKTLNNHGQIDVSNGALKGALTNEGVLTVANGSSASLPGVNDGVINVTGGSNLTGGFTGTGTINLDSSSLLFSQGSTNDVHLSGQGDALTLAYGNSGGLRDTCSGWPPATSYT